MHWPIVIKSAASGLAIAVLLGAWWLWWRLPKRQVDRLRLIIRDPKARADIEDNTRKTIGQLLGGGAVLIGAALAYVQFTQQQQASRDVLISNQVGKGFEQLGSGKLVVRFGGIYALEGVMNTSEQYHQPVLEALCAFVRDGTRTTTDDGPPVTDIQAALTVIGRRAAIGTGATDLSGAHIPQARLSNADLAKALLDDTLLAGADLDNANLSGALMFGTKMSGASLVNTNLSQAFMQSANLSSADLTGANLEHAILSVANLSHIYVEFTVGVNLRGADLSGANLSDAQLEFADLSGANLSGANLSSAHLDYSDLSGATVTQTQLEATCGKDVKLDPGLRIKPCS
jgi:uncharacterized protein YjbI with pentapeptide repeats